MHDEALELFRALLRLDTTNPPGNERAAAELLADSLAKDGLEPQLLDSAPGRTCVVTRLKGTGARPPLLLTAHLDVVAAEPSRWKHPPFGAVIDDGWLYGRGAVDMKHMAAMSAMVLKVLAREGAKLSRDVIFAAVADEEAGCALGSQWLVAHHPELVRAEYALGEIGGFTLHLAGARLYPIQVAQKGMVWLKARQEGTPGHGSMPREDNPVVCLAAALAKLSPDALPVHLTPAFSAFLRGVLATQPALARVLAPLLLQPRLAGKLVSLLPDKGTARAVNAVLRNTATPTVLRAGTKTNVIPSFAEAEIDGRSLPGQTVDDVLSEVREVLGPGVTLEVLQSLEPVAASHETPMFQVLSDVVRRMDPSGVPVPYLVPGFTDAAAFSKLGTTYYGFAPIVFPASPKVSFSELFHGDDERIPVSGFQKGLDALLDAVRTWCGG
jgi:acetylornithine deacetylase/succinyl-diaminopimelate desuccinylase-like protein